ncbi:MAG: type II toxin-antitoxin system RelE/ParE family toxin [Desulfuromonadales bacterium]
MPVRVIEFTASALADLEEILAWYADQGAAEVGRRLVVEIMARVGQLAEFPESGRIVPEFDLAAVRELIHPPFRIVYRLGTMKVWIVRVWRSERLLKMPG